MDRSGFKRTYEAVHFQVEIRVVPFDRIQQLSDFNFGIQFFADFTYQGFLRTFLGLDLPARKFPLSLELTISPPGRKNLCVPHYYRCNYFYCLHAADIFWLPKLCLFKHLFLVFMLKTHFPLRFSHVFAKNLRGYSVLPNIAFRVYMSIFNIR